MRHHIDPLRARPSLSLGSSGPSPTRADDADPTYEPPRIRGFSVADVSPEHVQRLADAGGVTFAEAAAAINAVVDAFSVPLLWDGDQA